MLRNQSSSLPLWYAIIPITSGGEGRDRERSACSLKLQPEEEDVNSRVLNSPDGHLTFDLPHLVPRLHLLTKNHQRDLIQYVVLASHLVYLFILNRVVVIIIPHGVVYIINTASHQIHWMWNGRVSEPTTIFSRTLCGLQTTGGERECVIGGRSTGTHIRGEQR